MAFQAWHLGFWVHSIFLCPLAATIISWMGLSFFAGITLGPRTRLRTTSSLIGNVVVLPDLDLLLEWEAAEKECRKYLEYLEEAEELPEQDLLGQQPASICMT